MPMRSKQVPIRKRPRGVILILVCFCLPLIIGMMGLGIDVGLMYAVKARLQMACDGASVAALRSLSLAQTTDSQTTAATGTATQWFRANFAGNYLGAGSTSAPAVTVVDDNTNHIRTVTVTASTVAPTYFMKLWGNNGTTVYAIGQASRRDVAIMLVLDRSDSMNNSNNTYGGQTPCQVMIQAAKQFTGMFQQGRDQIGLVTFAETGQVAQTPVTNFQTQLGYSNATGSSSGALDHINCTGGTNTSTGISLGWNEIYKLQLPGALNALIVFTDGQPTAGSFKFITTASTDPTGVAKSAFKTTSTCLDSTNKSMQAGGNMLTNPRNWVNREANSGLTVSLGANSFFPAISGPVGALYGSGSSMFGVDPFFAPAGATPLENTSKNSTEATGCAFLTTDNPSTDLAWVPPVDLFGNSSTGYISGITTQSIASANRITVTASNISKIVFNLTDNAGDFARDVHTFANGTAMPGTIVYTIGLGGNGGIDFTLLQRLANDPNADPHGAHGAYAGYDASQPIGTFVYSSDSSQLQASFMRLASMILRISK